MSDTCLFCGKPEKGYKPSKSVDFICSVCVQLLLAADQGELRRAYEKAVRLGYTGKASAIKTFLMEDDMQKPKNLSEVWSERDLCKRLDLPVTKCGRSLQLSGWIRGGLEYVEKSGRRYFFEQDVIEYLWKRSQTDQPE